MLDYVRNSIFIKKYRSEKISRAIAVMLAFFVTISTVATHFTLASVAAAGIFLLITWGGTAFVPVRWTPYKSLHLSITDQELCFSWNHDTAKDAILPAKTVTMLGIYNRRNSLFIWASLRSYEEYEQIEEVLQPAAFTMEALNLFPPLASNLIPITSGRGGRTSLVNPVLENLREVEVFIDFQLSRNEASRAAAFLRRTAPYSEKYVDRAWWNF